MLLVPELDFEVKSGTLGGRFTTIEGLLTQARDQLKSANPFSTGDSADIKDNEKYIAFIAELNKVSSCQNNRCSPSLALALALLLHITTKRSDKSIL